MNKLKSKHHREKKQESKTNSNTSSTSTTNNNNASDNDQATNMDDTENVDKKIPKKRGRKPKNPLEDPTSCTAVRAGDLTFPANHPIPSGGRVCGETRASFAEKNPHCLPLHWVPHEGVK
jgi:hypothetical protein